MPLLDLKDFKKIFNYVTKKGKDEITLIYGRISISTTGIILRKIIELEQQVAKLFFGAMLFDIVDLTRIIENGKRYANILQLTDNRDKPALFSTFMLCLLAEIYQQMPEKGDADRPNLLFL